MYSGSVGVPQVWSKFAYRGLSWVVLQQLGLGRWIARFAGGPVGPDPTS